MPIRNGFDVPLVDDLDLGVTEKSSISRFLVRMMANALGEPICVPVIVIDDQTIIGFDQQKIEDALSKE